MTDAGVTSSFTRVFDALLPAHDGSWPRALWAGAAVGAVYLVLFFINPAGMGFGDVKLAPTLGMAMGWYGWPTVFTGTFAGFLLGALTGLALIAARRADPDRRSLEDQGQGLQRQRQGRRS